ncbi:MAG: head decoration protein [Oscillospiraceae bacterium]|nr:head decoration protein [Oscillospiraceae bacterium]
MATIGIFEPDGLIAGDFPTEAQGITITGPAEIKRGDVLGLTDEGNYVLVDSTATNGSQEVVGIACDDVIVEDGMTATSTMFIKGAYIRRFLRFGGTDTVENHIRRMTDISLIVRDSRI